ncbi:MAG: PKD domain-containing protein [Sphingobacteriales bacterium]|nr:MAG: PKD domain-containing protein [Sphingobacteriales bacterium]
MKFSRFKNGAMVFTVSKNLIKAIFSLCLLLILLSSCSKKPDIPRASSLFEVSVYDSRYRKLVVSNTGLVDSAFHFDNLSTNADGVSYLWDFGDGSTSNVKEPQHIYKSFGSYKVSLITSRGNDVSKPFETELLVTTGQKKISLSETLNTTATRIIENPDNSFVLLGSSSGSLTGSNATPFLMSLDKNLRQTNLKIFPDTYRFSTLSACSDGNYIFAGTTSSNLSNNEIIKTTSAGSVLWSRVISGASTFTDIFQTKDNGYLLTGYKKINDVNRFVSVLVKVDGSGNVKWEKTFDDKELLEMSFNAIEDGDHYLIAGIKRTYPITCSECDNLSLLRINAEGKQISRTDIATNAKTNPFSPVRLAKLKDGNINVIINGSPGFYIFSPTADLLLRTNMQNENIEAVSTAVSNIVSLQVRNNNGSNSIASGYLPTGAFKWEFSLDGTEILATGFSCCNISQPVGLSALKLGGSILIANQLSSSKNKYSVVIVRLSDAGKIM